MFIQCTHNDWVYKIQRKGSPELLVTFLKKKKFLALILPERAVPVHRSGPGRGGGTPYDGLYEEAPPERGILFRLQVKKKKVGISLVDVYKRAGKSVIWVC